MITLVEFLEARLAEDEAMARSVEPLGYTDALGGIRIDQRFAVTRLVASGEDGSYRREADEAAAAHFHRHDPARVLREVAAKRRLLLLRANAAGAVAGAWEGTPNRNRVVDHAYLEAITDVLEELATAWSDHPDYRSEWRLS